MGPRPQSIAALVPNRLRAIAAEDRRHAEFADQAWVTVNHCEASLESLARDREKERALHDDAWVSKH